MTDDPAIDILNDPRFKGSPLTWEADQGEYDRIRHAFLTHVAAEEQLFQPYTEAEWDERMATMLSVFTDDCVMAIGETGEQWQGKQGAEAFYRLFIPAFQNMAWVPQALVIGPQGVLDVVNMTGVLVHDFAGMKATGQKVNLQWVIQFPWVPEQQKFKGETVYSIRPLSAAETQ